MDNKIWANSGDSHLVEPEDLFEKNLPASLAERMPRSVKDPDGEFETVHVDGQSFRRKMPKMSTMAAPKGEEFRAAERAPGRDDPKLRLVDLDQEGIWAEITYPSLGVWAFSIRDPKLLREGVKVLNDWAIDFQSHSPRYVCTASLPLLEIGDAVAEAERAAALGFKAVFLPVKEPFERPPFQSEHWEPLWDALESLNLVLGFHIGTEPHTPDQRTGVYHRGRGGAVMNYVETTYGGQKATTALIASGALDRHPKLKVLVSEGGATWGPFLADRMDEAYRQHSAAVRPVLSKLPSAFLFEQVYASFQHDRSAVFANSAMGWRNVMWGSDYPHYEGTFGHTQKTLHELFDDCTPEVSHRIRIGAFQELFPHVPAPPG